MNKKLLFFLVLILIISAVTHTKWINSGILTSGDWGFMFIESVNNQNYLFYWSPTSLGSVDILVSGLFQSSMIGLFSNMGISSSLSLKILVFYPLILLIASSFFLAYYLFKKNLQVALIFSIVYAYNTYTLVTQTGSLLVAIANALFPLVLLLYHFAIEKRSTIFTILSGLAFFILGSYEFRIAYICGGILLLYTLIKSTEEKEYLTNFKYLGIMLSIFFLLNSFWLFNMLFNSGLSDATFLNRSLFGNAYMNIQQSLTNFHPFWTGGVVTTFVVQTLPYYFWLIPLLAFTAIIFLKTEKDRKIATIVLFFAIISLIGIFLTKQVGQPFTGVYKWLFENFPGFNAFREASKFYFLINLGYAGLIAYTTSKVYAYFNSRKQRAIALVFVILVASLFLYNTKPMITGEIKKLFVPKEIPEDYLIFKSFTLNQSDYFRTFWTPTDSRWGIYTNNHPKISAISSFGSEWLEFANKSIRTYPEYVLYLTSRDYSNSLLDISSVKYVVVPIRDLANDDDFYISYGGRTYPEIRNVYVDNLRNLTWLKEIDLGTEELAVFENKDFKPHIYLTSEPETIHKTLTPIDVKHKTINPTKYNIELNNIKNTTYLNFAEAYHQGWALRLGKFNWFSALVNKKYFLNESFHYKNDATLNSFIIDPDYIKENYDSNHYTENPDGSINLDLTLYFRPQSYFNLGLIVSSITFISCIGYLVYDFVKNRKARKNENR